MTSNVNDGCASLKGKVALVTGGAGILGSACGAGFARSGASLALADLDEVGAREIAARLSEEFGAPVIGIGCDVTSAESVAAMVAQVASEFGDIDILHNNAAGRLQDLDAFFAPFEEYSHESWRTIMSVNIDGMFLVAQAVGREMIRAGKGGAIVQMSSIYGVVAPDNRIYEGSELDGRRINSPAVYAASKAAVIGLSRYLAAYWAPQGIRVNTVSPGGVFSGQNQTFVERYSARVPMARMAEAEEVVQAVLYLASDASSYVTGQNLTVDGGLTAW